MDNMLVDGYNTQNELLMQQWIEKHKAENGVKSFAKDGIVNPKVWFQLPDGKEKILFLLKEAYDDIEHRIWDEAKWIRYEKCMDVCKNDCSNCRASGTTFNPIAEWIYGIENLQNNSEKVYDNWLGISSKSLAEYYRYRDELLGQIAIMNLKKANGVRASNDADLYYHAALDKELLLKQLDLIKPTLIICGGTYDMLRCLITELPALTNSSNGCAKYDDLKIIAMCHPMAMVKGGNEEKYNQVVSLYKELNK